MAAIGEPSQSQKKTVITIALAILVVVLIAVVYWRFGLKSAATPAEQAADSFQKAVDSAAGILPEIDPASNPLEQMPDINAVERSNPFTDIKINPF
ncbi:MAG: hypothetical protein UY23_C0001G0303 [Candidatus Jorgensenbacteria bacterium GW2011_GWA1_48_11]|uniref:Uncharacterized protein n=1 Tax=Candidatus Jorgensenbacteria bacterium GW2011_GWA1_48_11 TaxID=1618660 RepID=A0A0G1UC49_9BACT|nr:MAG: hypothetical protein UY23_C0001G0303 [Candidatus Jorgensenbacteria bacterium GW2011_GWA1_48_11]KKW12188.1 MAG: hypothetical protein UY51_C0005G0430 [Candidatus Jorgensenbacteria bacterium GW2011_GWB1_49_9]